jgi:hypothetical protein
MTTSRASREELEAAHERVRMRTTIVERGSLRGYAADGKLGEVDPAFIEALLDDVDRLEAELAALRRELMDRLVPFKCTEDMQRWEELKEQGHG